MTRIVVAIPTIEQRGDAWEQMAEIWTEQTCQPIEVVPSWRKGSWSAGLNEVWENLEDADIFVCSSDDIYPENALWLPVVMDALARNESPVPLMHDPRFVVYGGSQQEVPDGTHTHMTNFPVLKGEWLHEVFPLPEKLHYCADNLIADRLHAIGVPTVARLDFVVRHTADERGRGAGMGSEEERMKYDVALYDQLSM
jgi:hypothetical protein